MIHNNITLFSENKETVKITNTKAFSLQKEEAFKTLTISLPLQSASKKIGIQRLTNNIDSYKYKKYIQNTYIAYQNNELPLQGFMNALEEIISYVIQKPRYVSSFPSLSNNNITGLILNKKV